MLQPLGYEVLGLNDLNQKIEIIEDGTTFQENALIKFHSAICIAFYQLLRYTNRAIHQTPKTSLRCSYQKWKNGGDSSWHYNFV